MKGKDPINSQLAIDSLRSQGFSSTSAICEIIDNSVEANATNIQISITYHDKDPGQKYERVKQFSFIDNGDGMNKELLHTCLVLGESTRRATSRGIGRFGVGATFGGISQGKRIEIFSKIKGGKWLYTCLDLDALKNDEGIREPIEKEPPKDYQLEHGTIIFWSKIDRGIFTKNLETELFNNVGRTYRKFLTSQKIEDGEIVKNKPITININGTTIIPYDPLFLTYNRRKEDTKLPQIHSKRYPIGRNDKKSYMWITISYLPNSWWDTTGAGNKSVNTQDRHITDRNEGISVVREDREVLFGDIPYFKLTSAKKKKFIEVDRWTGIEVAFNRDADELFEVQNNKSRLIISSYIRKQIADAISDTIEERREYVDKTRNKKTSQTNTTSTSPTPGTEEIQSTNQTSYTPEEETILDGVAETLTKNAEEHDRVLKDLLKGYHQIPTYDLDPNGPFVSYEHHLNSMIVKYNMKHSFMKAFIGIMDSIAERLGEDPKNALTIKENRELRILFDILMASFGQAKGRLGDISVEQEIDSTFNSLVTNWGDISNIYVKKRKDNDS